MRCYVHIRDLQVLNSSAWHVYCDANTVTAAAASHDGTVLGGLVVLCCVRISGHVVFAADMKKKTGTRMYCRSGTGGCCCIGAGRRFVFARQSKALFCVK